MGRRIHLLERALAAGSNVGENVGETLGGHCERDVGVFVVWIDCERNSRVRVVRRYMITKEYPSKCQTRYSATEHEALSRGPGGRSNTAKHKDERKPRARALAATSVFRGTCVLDTCPVCLYSISKARLKDTLISISGIQSQRPTIDEKGKPER